jgi:methionyl-tRNA formyltransferase
VNSIIFFGSFQHYSALTLEILVKSGQFDITAVVTTPPRPGNKLILTKNQTQIYAETNQIPCFPLETLNQIPPGLSQPDFILVSGYGKLIPETWLNFPKIMAINIHQSLLPNYAGRFPVEWAIIKGESKTGLTFIKMSSQFDSGEIIIQYPVSITSTDTRETLYTSLYCLAGQKSVELLPQITAGNFSLTLQDLGPNVQHLTYARQITREDGFIDWNSFQQFLTNPKFIMPKLNTDLDHLFRAFTPWPGIWTITPKNQRLKIISLKPLFVQIEGKKPVSWALIKSNFDMI